MMVKAVLASEKPKLEHSGAGLLLYSSEIITLNFFLSFFFSTCHFIIKYRIMVTEQVVLDNMIMFITLDFLSFFLSLQVDTWRPVS